MTETSKSDDGKALYYAFMHKAAEEEATPATLITVACNMLALAATYEEVPLEDLLVYVAETYKGYANLDTNIQTH